MIKRTRLLVVLFVLTIAGRFQPQPVYGEESIKQLILPGEAFLVRGRPSFILTAKENSNKGRKPWIFYAPTLPGYPDEHEKWMHSQFLEAGISVAGIDVGESYGSPEGQRLFTEFYQEMTQNRGFAKKPCLLGRSRGGLWVTSWACENTDKVAGITGIYPVFDFRTYPGIEPAARAYGLTPAQLAEKPDLNPIERVSKLAKAQIPVLLIHGDEDKVVPFRENSGEFASRYKAADAEQLITVIVAKGQGHNFWEGFFRSQQLVHFGIRRAREGALSAE